MSFEAGTTLCANCGDAEDEHCSVCWSCVREPVKECCMRDWPEHLKESERAHWAGKGKSDREN